MENFCRKRKRKCGQSRSTRFLVFSPIGVAITSQFPLRSSSSSFASHSIRNLLSNLDFFIVFKTSLRDARLFFSSFVVGEGYRNYKDLYSYFLEESESEEHPSEPRLKRQWLLFSFNSSTHPKYAIRQNLFNAFENRLFPCIPPSVLNFKN